MAKIQYDYLNIRFQKRYKNQGFIMKENTGLDTETYKGYVKLICDNEGDYKDVQSFTDILNFLTRGKFRGKYNWFYNIQFDFESIIKYLDYDQLIELYNNKEIQYNDKYKITYIPKKYFAIQDNSRNYYYFYDMYNFLDTSLQKASKMFLNDEKMLDVVDSSRLNEDLEYWNKNKDNIIKYCIKDALLTKNLADYFWRIIYKNLNFYPKSPMSKGKLSEEYFLHVCKIPTINNIPDKVIKTAYESFYGGHFEVLKRGYSEKIYSYDISSAYPAEIAQLIDFTKGKWEKVKNLEPSAHSGFYSCRVEALEKEFSPFKVKLGNSNQGLNIYPNGRFKQYLTKEEIEFYREYFPNATIKIDFGYEFYPKEEVKPFKSEIERLYQWKESEKNPEIKYCVKIILNSLYGKFIQVSGSNHQTGKLFNPTYAAKITAGARIKILKLACQKPDAVISFSTDSVSSMEKLKVPSNAGLGDFKPDFEGEGVMIMSDVYNYWNDITKKVKTKLRGFTLAVSKDMDSEEVYLKDILATSDNWINKKGELTPTIYEYFTERPNHLGECIMHRKTKRIDDLNIFTQHSKSIDINGDGKRIWEKDFKAGKYCLKELHNSVPILME